MVTELTCRDLKYLKSKEKGDELTKMKFSMKDCYTVDKSVLNESMVDAFTKWLGRAFLSFMVCWKNE